MALKTIVIALIFWFLFLVIAGVVSKIIYDKWHNKKTGSFMDFCSNAFMLSLSALSGIIIIVIVVALIKIWR